MVPRRTRGEFVGQFALTSSGKVRTRLILAHPGRTHMAVFGRDWNTPILTFHETTVLPQYHAFYSQEIPRHQA